MYTYGSLYIKVHCILNCRFPTMDNRDKFKRLLTVQYVATKMKGWKVEGTIIVANCRLHESELLPQFAKSQKFQSGTHLFPEFSKDFPTPGVDI